ncbi:MAG: hypothetical protein QM765_52325 [Myxococcales bacterium]
MVGFARKHGRKLLLVGGIATVAALVYHVGPAELWSVLAWSWPIVPAVVVLDLAWFSLEGVALLLFYGPARKNIPMRVWIHALTTHYSTMVVLPVGRVGAEAVRATMLAPYVGGAKTAAGAAQMQVMVLIANAVLCVPSFIAAASLGGWKGSLAVLVIVNFFANGGLGVALQLFLRKVKVGGWLGQKFASMVQWGPELDAELRSQPAVPVLPALLCVAGRSLQALEYGLVLATVANTSLTFAGTFIAEGIHIGAAALGDMVPNQVGVAEGMYRVFADSLGLAAHPERALAIALVVRVANFLAAGLCFGVVALLGGKAPPAAEPPPTVSVVQPEPER